MSLITGTVTTNITIGQNGITSPLTIAAGGLVDVATGDAIYSATLASVIDLGTVEATGGASRGIVFAAGGLVSVASAGLVSGFRQAVLAEAAATVLNAGVIESTSTGAFSGVLLEAGGVVYNSGTASRIEGYSGVSISGAAGTVTNAGTIEAIAAGGDGVALEKGGSIGNSGLVAGGAVGVYVSHGAGTVTNGGTIEAIGTTGGIGIQLASGGSVSNDNSAALIEGAINGIYVDGAAGAVTNAGTIAAIGSFANDGIQLRGGGSVDNVVSSALILGALDGIYVSGAAGTVMNAGTIESRNVYGISFQDGGTIVDSGSASLIEGAVDGIFIAGAAGTVTNAGTIAGQLDGVYIAAGAVTNTGTITATGTSGAGGVDLNGGGSVANNGTGSLIEGPVDGIFIAGAAGTVTNAGTVEGTGTNSAGILLENGGDIANSGGKSLIEGAIDGVFVSRPGTVTNAGTIAATGAGSTGVELSNGGTIINTGTIAGGEYAVGFGKGGGDLLALGPGYKLVGGIDINGTGNRLELLRGTAAGTLSELDSRFAGFATITVDAGAHWMLAGSNTIGAGGVLDNYGSLSGAVTLSAGGYLYNAAGATLGNKKLGVFSNGGTVVDGGEIKGKTAIYLGGTGNNLLALDPGYAISGKLVVEGTANGLELLRGAAAGVISGLGSKFADFATITVDAGASWTLSGSNTVAAGVTLQDHGVLTVERLTNAGSIDGNLYLAAGGFLSNAATGIIEHANADPVYIEGAGVRIVNAGTIEATHGRGAAVGANDGATIDNIGTNSLIAGSDYAIIVAGTAGTVTNQGTIESPGSDSVMFRVGGRASNSGLIDGGKYGVNIQGAAGVATNTGTIIGASGGSSGDGVALFAGGKISNAATGFIEGFNGAGVAGTLGTLINAGTIIGTNRQGFGLAAGGGVRNSGVIDGFQIGVYIGGAGGTVTNQGTIEGGENGVDVHGAAGGVTNTGTLLGTNANGVGLYDGGIINNSGFVEGANGVGFAGALGTLKNAGTIIGTSRQGAGFSEGGTVANRGLIEGLGFGVYIKGGAGTVTNAGTVEGTGASGVGIDLKTGGSVGSSGFISAANTGIYSGSGLGTVTNTGTILASVGGLAAVNFDAGGSVYNSSKSALIVGGAGIFIEGGSGTVTNAGTIESNNPSGGDAIVLRSGGSVSNTGFISAENAGIYIKGAGAMVMNAGTIEASSGGYAGIGFHHGGSVDNSGRTALIVGGAGIFFDGGSGRVTNAGTVESNNPVGGTAIALRAGGSIDNSLLIEGYSGIDIGGGRGVVTNTGTIEATGSSGTGILLRSGGTVVNSGTVEGTGTGAAAYAVNFQNGTDLLVVDPGAVFVGTVVGDGAASTLELAAGKAGTLSGLGTTSFLALGTVKIDRKAVWTLSGDASGSQLVNDGKVLVSSTQSLVFAAVTQDAGARGTIQLAGGAAEFETVLGKEQSLVFSGTGGSAKLDLPAAFSTTISGFASGDTIDLVDTPVTSLSFAKGVLTLSSNGKEVAALSFKGHYTTSEFAFSSDHSAGTLITIGKPAAVAAIFVHAEPRSGGGAPVGTGAFTPFGAEAALPAAGASDAGSPLVWTSDPFHFWTLPG
jgi:hypothetical protein